MLLWSPPPYDGHCRHCRHCRHSSQMINLRDWRLTSDIIPREVFGAHWWLWGTACVSEGDDGEAEGGGGNTICISVDRPDMRVSDCSCPDCTTRLCFRSNYSWQLLPEITGSWLDLAVTPHDWNVRSECHHDQAGPVQCPDIVLYKYLSLCLQAGEQNGLCHARPQRTERSNNIQTLTVNWWKNMSLFSEMFFTNISFLCFVSIQ